MLGNGASAKAHVSGPSQRVAHERRLARDAICHSDAHTKETMSLFSCIPFTYQNFVNQCAVVSSDSHIHYTIN